MAMSAPRQPQANVDGTYGKTQAGGNGWNGAYTPRPASAAFEASLVSGGRPKGGAGTPSTPSSLISAGSKRQLLGGGAA